MPKVSGTMDRETGLFVVEWKMCGEVDVEVCIDVRVCVIGCCVNCDQRLECGNAE